MPFPDSMFNFVICTAAFKNFKEPIKALSEIKRVLKPGATALIIDMNRDVSNEKLDESIQGMNLRGFNKMFMKLTFKYFLKLGAYTKEGFKKLISQLSFSRYEIKEIDIGLYVYLRK